MSKHVHGTFIAAAVTVPANTTYSSDLIGGVDFTSRQIDITGVESIAVIVESTGANAAINADIHADLVVAVDDAPTDYTTINVLSQAYDTVTIHATTNAAERAAQVVGVEGCAFIGIGRIRNEDPTYSADVQVYFGKYERITPT